MAGNSFGHLFRVTTWGESHGPEIGCVVDGVPPRIAITEADIQHWMDRRKPGQSRFTTQRKEPDQVQIVSGWFEGHTTGTPLAMVVKNVDQRSKDYGDIAVKYRPGHADYTYDAKYGIRDHRGGGRSSARETAMRVAAGAVARKVLGDGITIRGAVTQIGASLRGSRKMGLGPDRKQSVLVPRPGNGRNLGIVSRWCAQARFISRRGDRDCGFWRAGRPGQSDL